MAPDFGSIFRTSPNAYVVVDAELRFVAANDAYLRVVATSWSDLAGKSLFEVFPNDPTNPNNDAAQMLRRSFERVLQTGKPDALAFIPYTVPMHEGGKVVTRERYWSATHTPLHDADGKVTMVLQHTVDVTELYELRRAIGQDDATHVQWGAAVLGRARSVEADKGIAEEQRDHLLRVFHNTPGFMTFLRGPDHVFEIANAGYLRLIGRTENDADSILGRTVADVLPEVAAQGYVVLLDRVLTTGEPYYGYAERLFLKRDDAMEEVFLDFTYQAIRDANGNNAGILVHGYDITSHIRLERERDELLASERRANQAKDDFLATVSHELRTPLNAIMGYVHLLRQGQLPADKQTRAFEALDRNTRAQAQVINDLLDISRIVSGKLELVRADATLANVVYSAIDAVRPALEAKRLGLATHLDESLRAFIDESRMHQVVWNLLSNATKFTPEGGSLEVVLSRDGGQLVLSVRDTGVGIAPEYLPRIFDRFNQGDRITTRAYGGLGLGLAIVRNLVELHGGKVIADSAGVGRGTVVTVTLPEASRDETPETHKAAVMSSDALKGLRILVVDDEADAREVVKQVLERVGASVTIAGAAPEARRLFDAATFDLVLSDIGMPGEDGYSFIRRLRAEHPRRLGAIALSAYARKSDIAEALAAGFDQHLAKPFDPADLITALALLAKQRLPT